MPFVDHMELSTCEEAPGRQSRMRQSATTVARYSFRPKGTRKLTSPSRQGHEVPPESTGGKDGGPALPGTENLPIDVSQFAWEVDSILPNTLNDLLEIAVRPEIAIERHVSFVSQRDHHWRT